MPVSVVLHVGLPKTGTTYLQRLLADNRDQLRAAGVLYPFLRPGAMFEGAVEVRGSAAKFGLDPGRIAGTWGALCARAREFYGTTVISHEVLGGATTEQIDAALAPLAGLDVHVVVTARDLGRQATAHWQEEVKLGATMSFADFERDQLRADTGRDAGPDAGGRRPHFWHAQDFADALARWTRALPPGRAHLVICPAPAASGDELWRRFAAAVGVRSEVVAVPDEPANPSLGAAEVALLRAVNAQLGGRIPPGDYHRVVKRGWAEAELATRVSAPLRAPAALGDVLEPTTRRWLDDVRAAGVVVHGEVDDLEPVLADPAAPAPDAGAPPAADVDAAVARLLRAAAPAGRRRWRSRSETPLRRLRDSTRKPRPSRG